MVNYLNASDILYIHRVLAIVFEEDGDPIVPSGPRDPDAALVHSAAERPRTALGGTEKYRTIEAKAAALFHSLVQNHAFHNGNKRTALVSMVRFLDLNRHRIEATDDDLFLLVTSVAKGQLPASNDRKTPDELVEGVHLWLDNRCARIERANGEVRVKDFNANIAKAGGRVKVSSDGHSWVLHGPLEGGKSVRIKKSTTRLAGMVARVYAKRIGFTDGQSGISFDDLTAGIQPEQRIIRDLIEVLRMLAHV
ncbi:type II toxin-antitoxin system death-on-curing family toxin [Burkholderia ubonensis]|uniref:type II toxin-antitoxin system death-on-curing family toxin n=1 Tax=Burkholderia ubonensis TaxID=101571 RepID=UPI000758C0D8|nr:type II toxin-antitoxin system death-on-curing family toxin [Burkholderia ubonensis]KVD66214.1 hypothetical protein WI86_24005 [Burkholderia ubonensis]KVN48842.1 hypothetical protein WJ64_21385 [Burkholderia ubonensis]KVR24047.1 hypothetical protein WK15_20520 [Burkholderia ubonensis]KVU85268.1 hypothetical protein WK74_13905 [Burkholderia ubonensis]KVX19469.1 hypothetical protein WL03_10950 [Burkholderia ubonensis]